MDYRDRPLLSGSTRLTGAAYYTGPMPVTVQQPPMHAAGHRHHHHTQLPPSQTAAASAVKPPAPKAIPAKDINPVLACVEAAV